MTTEILTSPEVDTAQIIVPFEDIDPQDGDKYAHIINPAMNIPFQLKYGKMGAKEISETARMIGVEIIALCGYKFVPKHDPAPLPVCDSCLQIAGLIISEDG